MLLRSQHPVSRICLPAFAIDRTAVTNRRYRRFLEEADGTVEFDHPEQDRRSHLPAHWHDARFNAPDNSESEVFSARFGRQ